MSREMKSDEIDSFEKKYGYKPTQIRVAIDALAVYVNKDNPLEQLTLPAGGRDLLEDPQAAAARPIANWGQLGVQDGQWASQPISLYGRNSASGTYGFFKEHALCKGDYKDTVKEQPGSASVVQGVTEDRFGIGYSGIGYRTSGVRPLTLAAQEGRAVLIVPTPPNVYAGKYPLSRFLYVYVNKAPNKPLDPLVREFLHSCSRRKARRPWSRTATSRCPPRRSRGTGSSN